MSKFLRIQPSGNIGMGLFIVGTYFGLRAVGLLDNPLVLFYLAYSIQFSLFAPVVFSLRSRRPPAAAALAGLVAAASAAIAWGAGFTIASLQNVQSVWGLATSDIVYLAPLPPMVIGVMVTSAVAGALRIRSGRE